MAKTKPTANRPQEFESDQSTSDAGQSAPDAINPAQMSTMATANSGELEPTQTPPAASTASQGNAGASFSDKRITGLWSINQNRNSWVFITGIGWKRFATNSDSAIVALTALASHARVLNRRVDYTDDANGLITEMYVW